jgi:predicted N-acyltransferase
MALDISSYHSAKHLPKQVRGLITNCFNDLLWLSAFEEYSGISMEPCHHLMTSNDIPIGFLPGYIQSESLYGTLRDRLFGRFSRVPIFKNWGTQNALVCSSPWGFYSGIECREKDRNTIYRGLINIIDQTSSQRKLGLSAFTFVPESSHELRTQLESNGYKPFPTGPTTFLTLKWNSFDEYISDLPSKNIRNVIRGERKKAKCLSFEWVEDNSLERLFGSRPLSSILMDLYNNTYYKHNGKNSLLNDSFLSELWEIDKSNLRLCIAKLDRKVVSFVLLRVFENTAHALMLGRDYSRTDDFHSYFNVAYNETISRGIKEGWNIIYFRPSVYQVKLRRGCQLENLYLYIKGQNFMSQTFLDLYIPITREYFRDKYSPPKLFSH